MIHSMTGYSRLRREFPWGTLSIEISSVNSRYLETTLRTDRELSAFEPLIQNQLRSRIPRGKVTLRAELKWAASLVTSRLNMQILGDYYREIRKLQSELGAPQVDLADLLALPGVTETSSFIEKNTQEVQTAVRELLSETIDGLSAMREAEGRALYDDVLSNLDAYDQLIARVAEKWKEVSSQVFDDYRQRVTKNIAQLGYEADPARLAQELVILSDKWDISEELTRSASHVAQFRDMLQKGGTVGRKLDFLTQEMNREINTIGSKSASTQLRWLVVDGKTLLERIREQIQNIE